MRHTSPSRMFSNYLVLIYLLLAFYLTALLAWTGHLNLHQWNIADWLINYRGGFVRRGLFGELALFIRDTYGLNPSIFVVACQVFFYGGFMLFSYLLIIRQERIGPMAFLIFSPFIFSFQINNPGGGFRKEILYFFALSLVGWAAVSYKKEILKKLFYIIIAIFPIFILSHEMLIIFLPYIICIYFLMFDKISKNEIIILLILLLFSAITFYFAAFTPTDKATVSKICRELGDASDSLCRHMGAISMLLISVKSVLPNVLTNVIEKDYMIVYPFYVILVAIAFIPVRGRVMSAIRDMRIRFLIFASIGATLPLSLVALDWGRFIYIHAVSMFIICLVIGANDDLMRKVKPSDISLWANSHSPTKRYLAFAALLLYGAIWNIEATGGIIGSGPIRFIIQ